MTMRLTLAAMASCVCPCIQAADSSHFTTVWSLGADDDQRSPFTRENYSPNLAPGSSLDKDDDYYLGGSYPPPIGVLAVDEDLANIERALTEGDPRNRIHFPLSAAERSSESVLRISIDLIDGGAWVSELGGTQPGFHSHDLSLTLNGVGIGTWTGIHHDQLLLVDVPAADVGALAEDNVLQIERVGGTTGGYIQFDYLQLAADPDALADGDLDGLPRWFEEEFGFDDGDPSDADSDFDGDGLSNGEEFGLGTNPTDPDTDKDGLHDAEELTTDPLDADSDGDGLKDGEESLTDPTLSDSDGDGFPDGDEVLVGSDPNDSSSSPFPVTGSIAMHFVCELHDSQPLGSWQRAGVIPSPHWNHSDPLPHWNSAENALTGSKTALMDGTGAATTAAVSFSYDEANSGFHGLGPNETLFNGMLRTDNYSAENGGNLPVTLDLSGIPFPNYDLLLYVGHRHPGRLAYTQLGADPATRRYLVSGSAPPFIGWNEATATSLAEVDYANFVRYRGLSGSSQSVTLHQIDASEVSLHGFQIIDTASDHDGDGLSDSDELEFGLDPAVDDSAADADDDGSSNLDELSAGTDPHDPDSDDDGLIDGAEVSLGTDPLDGDSDDDGLSDGREVAGQPFPSSPLLADSDSDGHDDAIEVAAGSDPMNGSSTPPPVPVWDGVNHRWHWLVDDIQLLWNHNQSLLAGHSSTMFEVEVELDDGGWSSSLGIGLYYRDGVVTHRFRCINDVFYENGDPSNSFYSTGSTSPTNDRKADLGFSGFGEQDDSFPLRLEFTATQPDPAINDWTLVMSLYQTVDATNPVLIETRTWTGATAADPRLLDGTAPWTDPRGTPGVPALECEAGIHAFVARAPLGPTDQDNDAMPDDWETTHGLDPADPSDALLDPDVDGLNHREEYLAGTHPFLADSDGDGIDDGQEVRLGSSPTESASVPSWYDFNGTVDDLDGDGMSDAWLMWSGGGSRVPSADDDGDGMSNLEESEAGTDPDDPQSRLDLVAIPSGNDLRLEWPDIPAKQHAILFSSGLDGWAPLEGLSSTASGGRRSVDLIDELDGTRGFYRASVGPVDSDGDGVEDWVEEQVLFTSSSDPDSAGLPSERNGLSPLSGDAVALLERTAQGQFPGSGSGSVQTSPSQAARFLMQASFGPTMDSIEEVRSMGFEAWIEHQLSLPVSHLTPYIQEIKRDARNGRLDPLYDYNEGSEFVTGINVTTPWARHAIGGEDQLRQRVAFALSQILVVSRRDAQLQQKPEGIADYYDMLSEHAFGNYGELLLNVATHPAMGWYLSHVGNQKADPTIPRFPDENFAREIMQLFSIGLWELNPDGTRKLDGSGEPIETYGNGEITELARVFTGLYYDSPYGWGSGGWDDSHYVKPMVMHPEHHDFGTKRLLNGYVIPARNASTSNGMKDIEDAIGSLLRHPNTAPFISTRLIQFLVTANPSPGYVGRVSSFFVDDGSGQRGNLAAVIKAILLDPEARRFPDEPAFGKLREPVIRTMHLGRLMKLTDEHSDFVWRNSDGGYYEYSFQEPTSAPNVFNFFTPEYQAPGEIRQLGLVSPGFQIVDSYSSISFPNLLWDYLIDGFSSGSRIVFPCDYSDWMPLAEDNEALLDRASLLLCAGQLSVETRNALRNALAEPGLTGKDKIAVVLWTLINSPEGSIQH